MLKRIIHAIAKPRHPWRDMQFDELAEIYTSVSLRSFGFGIIGIFVPVFLYTEGVTLQGILLFYSFFFVLRVPASIMSAYIIGRVGPKHAIAMSTVLVIAFLSMLLTYTLFGWPLLALAVVFTAANGLFFIAYYTDFSKVQHKQHGGKELGWLLIFEQVGKSLGPIVGGLLAGLFAPEVTLLVAICVLLGSLVPLFLTNEPVKLHQHISFRSFSIRNHIWDFISLSGHHISIVSILTLWPLYIAAAVFKDGTYEKLGIVIGVSVAISIFSARMFGKFIDARRGWYLLRYGVVMNVALLISKSLITGAGGVVAASTLGQPILLAYRMTLHKGEFDVADSIEKHRIVYLSWHELFSGASKGVFCIFLLALSQYHDPIMVLRFGFGCAAVIGLLMLTQRFQALKKV